MLHLVVFLIHEASNQDLPPLLATGYRHSIPILVLSLFAIALLALGLPLALVSVARTNWHPIGLAGLLVMILALVGLLRGRRFSRLVEMARGNGED